MASQNDMPNLNVFFVVDAVFKSEEQCSDDMWHAFNKCDGLDIKPNWILAKDCFDLKPEKTDVFIIEKFEGDVFEFLQKFKCSIVGPRLLVKCFTTGEPLPGTSSPVLNTAMDKIVVSVSGFSASVKEDIRKKVEYMGGVYTKSLKGCVTHLVTNTVMSAKYEAAIKSKLCVVQDKWVYAIWDANLDEFVTAADPRFEEFKCPIFLNLLVTTSNVPVPVKENIKQLISSNGGEFSGALDCTKVQIVLTVRDGDSISKKLKCAQQKNIACLAYEWVLDSVKAGSALPLDDYMIKPMRMCSSPNRTDASFALHSMDLSRISSAGSDYNSVIQETINTTTTSGTSITPPGVKTNTAIGDVAHLVAVDSMSVDEVKKAGPFLDGCSIYLIGFTSIHREKLNKILSYSGATRLDNPTESLTHVIVGDVTKSTSEIQTIHMKDTNPFIVNVKWLQESIRLKKPAFEDDFLIEPRQKEVPKKRIEPASPLSKKNLAMLSRTKPSLTVSNHSIRKLNSTSSSNQTNDNSDGSDLVMKYLQADPQVTSKSTVLDNNSSKSSTLEPQNDQSNAPSSSKIHESSSDGHNVSAIPFSQDTRIFQGLTFTVSQFSNEESRSLVNIIKQHGGKIVNLNITPDFSVVPIDGLVEGKEKKVVTELFIDECADLEELIDVQYYHEPITYSKEVKPLKECVISLTSYNSSERRYLEHLTEVLGARCQNTFAKSTKADVYKNTHLICANTQGKKYTAAIKWKIPAVSCEWLLACAEKCDYVDEAPFLVGESKLSDNGENLKKESSINNCALTTQKSTHITDVGKTPTTTLVNKILNNVRGGENVQSPFHVDTPTSPYGRCFMNNPTRSLKKDLKRWVDGLPDYHEPPAKKRRQSTPLSELKRKLMEKCVKESEVVALQYSSPGDRSPSDDVLQSEATTKRKLSFTGLAEVDPLEEIKKVLKNASDLRESLSGENNRQVNVETVDKADKYIVDTQCDDVGWDNEECEPSVTPKVVKRKFMLSGTKDRQVLENIILSLGGEVSQTTDFDPDATHVVCLKPGRNEKLLGSIAGGKWVLHVNYLLDSEQNEAFLNEESYEFGNPMSKDNIPQQTGEIEKLIAAAAYKWRTKLQETPGGGAFKDMVALLLVLPDKYDQFKRLILAGGGVVVESRPPYDTAFGGRKITHCFVQPKQASQPIEWASLANKGILCFSPQFLSEQLTSDTPLNPRDCVVPEFKKYLSLLPT